MRLNSRHLITALAVVFGLAACSEIPSGSTSSPATANNGIVSNTSLYKLSSIGTDSPNRLYTLYDSGSLTASINGDDYLYSNTTGNWFASAAGGDGTYSYQWQYRAQGSGTWSNVGSNSSSYSRSVSGTAPSFYLRVIVTSAGVSVTSSEFLVYHEKEPMCGVYLC